MSLTAVTARLRLAARRTHFSAFLVLAAIAATLYYPIFSILPFGGDNLYVLAWVDQAPAATLFELDPAIYPEWRPLAYQSIWLEHTLVQLNLVAVHHSVNLLLWAGCAWLVYHLVIALTASTASAWAAALLLLVDRRSVWSLVWIVERQSTLACACGLAACLLVVRRSPRPLRRLDGVAVTLLLLASALSKEYGLAFSAALMVYGAMERRRDLALAGVAAGALYGGLRVTLAGGALAVYCEDMGYFFETYSRCIDPLAGQGLGQMAYNALANGLGTTVQGLLNNEGLIEVQPTRLALGLASIAMASIGALHGDRRLRLLAMVPVFNALLGMMIYRHRNQVIGISALAVAAGVGLWVMTAGPRPLLDRRAWRSIALSVLAGLALWHAVGTRQRVQNEVAELLRADPCLSDLRQWPYVDRFAQRVKLTYGLDDPQCATTAGY